MEANELDKVHENLNAWIRAFNDKDIDTLMSLYDPEHIYANAASPLMRGIEEAKPWFLDAFKNVEGTLHHKEEAAFIENGMAILLGIYYFEPPEGVTPPEDANLTGRVLLTYRRNADGEWKLLCDIDNTPPDVSPASFT